MLLQFLTSHFICNNATFLLTQLTTVTSQLCLTNLDIDIIKWIRMFSFPITLQEFISLRAMKIEMIYVPAKKINGMNSEKDEKQ